MVRKVITIMVLLDATLSHQIGNIFYPSPLTTTTTSLTLKSTRSTGSKRYFLQGRKNPGNMVYGMCASVTVHVVLA